MQYPVSSSSCPSAGVMQDEMHVARGVGRLTSSLSVPLSLFTEMAPPLAKAQAGFPASGKA